MSDRAKRRRQAKRRRRDIFVRGWTLWFTHAHGRPPSAGEILKRSYPGLPFRRRVIGDSQQTKCDGCGNRRVCTPSGRDMLCSTCQAHLTPRPSLDPADYPEGRTSDGDV